MPLAWRRHIDWGFGLVVLLSSAALVLPVALRGVPTSPDTVEHLAIANAWVNGQGFVDPIQYYYYLPESPPIAAFAVRAPLVPLLLAPLVANDLTLREILVVHAVWAVFAVVASFLLMRRFMHPFAAAAAALLSTSTLAWVIVASAPLTEVTAWLIFVAIVASASAARQSHRAALVCAALTWLGWLARPNMGVLVAVFGLVAVIDRGPRRALRDGPLGTYLAGFVVLYAATHLLVRTTTGLAPYAGYSIITEHLDGEGFDAYAKTYVGAIQFFLSNAGEIAATVWHRSVQLVAALFLLPAHGRLGWLIPVGLVHTAFRWRRVRFAQKLCSLAALAFAVPVVVNYAAYDAVRYPMFTLMAGVVASVLALEDIVRGWIARADVASQWPHRAPAMAAAAVLGFVALQIASMPGIGSTAGGPSTELAARQRALHPIARVCPSLDPDALVASPTPWALHRLCGNASILIPRDIDVPGVSQRFIAERRPSYWIVRDHESSVRPGLTRLTRAGRYTVFAVGDPERAEPIWHAPPALVCAGGDPLCELREGRIRLRAVP